MHRKENRLLAIGLRIAAISCFSCMGAAIKLSSMRGVGPLEMLFYRNLFSAPVIVAWIALGPGFGTIRTQRPMAHITRATIGLVSMGTAFQAIIMLPLAEATTIGFSAPLFATVLSALLLSEKVGPHRWAAVALGFAGVVVVMQPGAIHGSSAGITVAVVSACLVACVVITLRQITATENVAAVVFWFTMISLAVTALALPLFVQPHDAMTWALLGAIGLSGGAAQIMNTASVGYAPIAALAPFDYFQLVGATLFGYFLFDQGLSGATLAGAALIIASGLYTIHREHKLHRNMVSAIEQPIS